MLLSNVVNYSTKCYIGYDTKIKGKETNATY